MLEDVLASSAGGLARVRSLRAAPKGFSLDGFSADLIHSRYANSTARRIVRKCPASAVYILILVWSQARALCRRDQRGLPRLAPALFRRTRQLIPF